MFVQPQASPTRLAKLALVMIALVAATMATSVPSASAQTTSGVAQTCTDGGVVVIDEGLGRVWCVQPGTGTTADGTIQCPAPSRPATEVGVDESKVVGGSQIIANGACYYDTTCPAGYRATGLIADGPNGTIFTAECRPSDLAFESVLDADNCVAVDGIAAQWFPEPGKCAVVITPPALAEGVSTARQDCVVAGGSYSQQLGLCLVDVYRDDLAPQPTIAPPGPTPMPTVVVDPTAAPVPTATPDVAPTATPVTPVVPIATVTPTPDHPGFGFTG